jgi:hypothetical protein
METLSRLTEKTRCSRGSGTRMSRFLLTLFAVVCLFNRFSAVASAEDECEFVEERANTAASKFVFLKEGQSYVPKFVATWLDAIRRVKEIPEYYLWKQAETGTTAEVEARDRLLHTPEWISVMEAAALLHQTDDFKRYLRVINGLMVCRKVNGFLMLVNHINHKRSPLLRWSISSIPMPIGSEFLDGYVMDNYLIYL